MPPSQSAIPTTKTNMTAQNCPDLKTFHVLVLNAIDFLQQVAQTINKLLLLQGLDDVAALWALLNHSIHDVRVADVFCEEKPSCGKLAGL